MCITFAVLNYKNGTITGFGTNFEAASKALLEVDRNCLLQKESSGKYYVTKVFTLKGGTQKLTSIPLRTGEDFKTQVKFHLFSSPTKKFLGL